MIAIVVPKCWTPYQGMCVARSVHICRLEIRTLVNSNNMSQAHAINLSLQTLTIEGSFDRVIDKVNHMYDLIDKKEMMCVCVCVCVCV